MKQNILTSLLCLALLCGYMPGRAAETQDSEKPSEPKLIVMNPAPLKANRPKIGGQRNVKCYYQDGWLYISFPESEGLASLTLRTEEGHLTTWRPFGTWKEYSCYIGEVSSTLRVSVKTTAGYEYSGYLDGWAVDNSDSDWE